MGYAPHIPYTTLRMGPTVVQITASGDSILTMRVPFKCRLLEYRAGVEAVGGDGVDLFLSRQRRVALGRGEAVVEQADQPRAPGLAPPHRAERRHRRAGEGRGEKHERVDHGQNIGMPSGPRQSASDGGLTVVARCRYLRPQVGPGIFRDAQRPDH